MTVADRRAALARAEAWGVDLSLLRERLRMTPAERLARHAEALARVQALIDAKRAMGRAKDRALLTELEALRALRGE